MGYFNFTIPRNKRASAGSIPHTVSFAINSSGVLKVRAGLELEEPTEDGGPSLWLLSFYVVILFVLYVALRVAIPRDIIINNDEIL
jgi:hypothetical protein